MGLTRADRIADEVLATVLVGVAALVPLVFTTRVADVFTMPKLVLLGTLTGIGLAATAVRAACGHRVPLPTTWRLVALLVGWTCLATAMSRAPAVSFLGLYGRGDGLVSLVLAVAVAWLVVAAAWDRPDRLEALALAFVGGAVIAAVYVWIQRLGWDWNTWFDSRGRPVRRPQGTLGNSTFSGAHQAIALALAIGVAPRLRGWARTGVLAAMPLMAGAIWFTSARAAILGALVGAAVAGLLAPAALPRWARTLAASFGAFGAAVTVAVVLSGNALGRIFGLDVLRSDSLEVRHELWIAAARAIGTHPVIGTGPDTFFVTYLEHRRPAGGAFAQNFAAEPHNIFLDRAVETGLIGVGLLVAVVASVWRAALRADRDPLLAGFAGAFSAYLVQGLFSVDTVGLTVAAWIAIAAIAVLADPRLVAARRSPRPEPTSRPLAVGTAVGIMLILMVWMVVSVRPLTADRALRVSTLRGRSAVAALDAARRATEAMPFQPHYHEQLAIRLVATVPALAGDDPGVASALLAEAEDEIVRALELFPDHVGYLATWADVEMARARLGDRAAIERAAEHLRRALVTDPYGWATLEKAGEVATALIPGSDDRETATRTALEFYLRSAEVNPSRERPWVAIRNLAMLIADRDLIDRADGELAALGGS